MSRLLFRDIQYCIVLEEEVILVTCNGRRQGVQNNLFQSVIPTRKRFGFYWQELFLLPPFVGQMRVPPKCERCMRNMYVMSVLIIYAATLSFKLQLNPKCQSGEDSR